MHKQPDRSPCRAEERENTLTLLQPLHPEPHHQAVVLLVLDAPGAQALDGLHGVGDSLEAAVQRGLQAG